MTRSILKAKITSSLGSRNNGWVTTYAIALAPWGVVRSCADLDG